MAETSLSLAVLFEQAFGYRSAAFEPHFEAVKGKRAVGVVDKGRYGSPYYAADDLGREYFMPVTLIYSDGDAGRQRLTLPYPVVSVSGRKSIVETPMTERRGTVKELLGTRDFEITIRGFVVAEGEAFPEDGLIALRNLFEQALPLTVECPMTDIFLLRADRSGSDQVVMVELGFPPVTGVKHVRPYLMRLVSDEPFELEEMQ